MKRTPWVFMALRIVALFVIALATYVGKEGTSSLLPPLSWLGHLISRSPNLWILWSAVVGLILEVVERTLSTQTFRKEKLQALLDQIVSELFDGKPKEHRCTLFRAARGFVVVPILIYRSAYHEHPWRHIRTAAQLDLFGLYLYAWARARGNHNDRSCVAFRVYRRSSMHGEGVAGRVWESDEFEANSLPALTHDDLRGVASLDALALSHPAVKYARAGFIDRVEQLSARERFAKHFYGGVIQNPRNLTKWGVLLVDSTAKECPWPIAKRGPTANHAKEFRESFQSWTKVLSSILT